VKGKGEGSRGGAGRERGRRRGMGGEMKGGK